MDYALVISGVVDTVYRDAELSEMPAAPSGGSWVEAGTDVVFGGFTWDGVTFSPPTPDIDALQDAAMQRLMAEWRRQDDAAEATATGGGASHVWGADQFSLLRIVTFTAAVNANLNVPDPMPWYPKGTTTAVNCTRSEMKGIGLAIIDKSDQVFRARIAHEADIIALAAANDANGLRSYDVTTGWPA